MILCTPYHLWRVYSVFVRNYPGEWRYSGTTHFIFWGNSIGFWHQQIDSFRAIAGEKKSRATEGDLWPTTLDLSLILCPVLSLRIGHAKAPERCTWFSYNFPVALIVFSQLRYPCCNVLVFPVIEPPPHRSFSSTPSLVSDFVQGIQETPETHNMWPIKPWFPPKSLLNQPVNSILVAGTPAVHVAPTIIWDAAPLSVPQPGLLFQVRSALALQPHWRKKTGISVYMCLYTCIHIYIYIYT